MQSFAAGLNGLLSSLVQGFTESIDDIGADNDVEEAINDLDDVTSDPNYGGSSATDSDDNEVKENEVVHREDNADCRGKKVVTTDSQTPSKEKGETSSPYSVPPMHSQIFMPSDSDLERSDGSDNSNDYAQDSPVDCTQQADDLIRGSAANLAAKLKNLKEKKTQSVVGDPVSHNAIKLIVARELHLVKSGNAEETVASDMLHKISKTPLIRYFDFSLTAVCLNTRT